MRYTDRCAPFLRSGQRQIHPSNQNKGHPEPGQKSSGKSP
jgi:hypothetical protein